MKLFVDDIRNAPDDTWTVARTVTSAIKAIAQFEFETISLDHDISHQVSVGNLSRLYPCEETFQAVAYFIGEKYWKNKKMSEALAGSEFGNLYEARSLAGPKIILHTSNPVGGKEMEEILKGYGLSCHKKYMGAANRLEMEA